MSLTEAAPVTGALADLPPLFDTATLARVLSTTPRHCMFMRRDRTGPPWVRLGRHIRYRRDSVAAWLEENTSA